MNQPKRMENARVLIANTAMDTDKIKVFGSKVRVHSTAKVAELEQAEKVCAQDGGIHSPCHMSTHTHTCTQLFRPTYMRTSTNIDFD